MNEKLRVLIIDDSEIAARQIKVALANHSQSTVWANNGIDALQKIKSQVFDLITLDLNMPEMNGIEFLENLAPLRVRPFTIVISADKTKAMQSLALGANCALPKPLDQRILLGYVKQAKAHMNETQALFSNAGQQYTVAITG